MAWQPLQIGSQSNPGRNSAAGGSRLINCYVEDTGQEGKARATLYACDSFSSWVTAPVTSEILALINLNDTVLYGVAGTTLFRVTTSGIVTTVGTVSNNGRVAMVRNRRTPGPEIGIVTDSGNYYILRGDTPVLTPVSEAFLSDINNIAVSDGYFILTKPNGEFYLSAIDLGSTVDELSFAVARTRPDELIAPATRGTDLVLLKESSVDFYANTGNADFPYERSASADGGCYTARSVQEITIPGQDGTSDTIIYIGTDADGALSGVMMLSGMAPVKISTHAVDRAIRAEPSKTAIRSFRWSRDGHVFYGISGTTFTWIFDAATGLWHERQSSGLDRWRGVICTQFNGDLIVGDYANGALYKMSPAAYSASVASVSLQHSNDNGATYTTARSKAVGTVTDQTQRFKWLQIGQSLEDGKVFKFQVSNALSEAGTGVPMTIIPPVAHAWPNPMRFYSARLDLSPGISQNATPVAVTGLGVDVVPVKG